MSQSEALLIEKTFDAPVEKVWDAWEDPKKLSTWWCIDSMRETVITEYDFRPGGTWRQHGIDNTGFALGTQNPGAMFKEIVPLEKIVTVPNTIEGDSVEVVPDLEQTVVSFERIGDGQTKLTIKVLRKNIDDWQPNELLQSVYDQIFDNLADFLAC